MPRGGGGASAASRGRRSGKRARCAHSSLIAPLIAFAIVLLFASAARANSPSNEGTEFWLGLPRNSANVPPTDNVYITGSTATTGTVAIPGESFTQGFTVTPGGVSQVTLPSTSEIDTSDGVEEKGIHVTAGSPVAVYVVSDGEYTTDGYTGLPMDALGTSYTVLAYGDSAAGESEFSVVASQNHTIVTITPSARGGDTATRPAGTPYTVTLNEGQEYQLQAFAYPEDLTGTKITSSAPVSVYGGNSCAYIPSGSGACDYVVEENPPESSWGSSFLTEPLKGRSGGDYFSMVADQNNTHVYLNGGLVATLNADEHYAQEVVGASEFTADNPIELAQFANGLQYAGIRDDDPMMMAVVPTSEFETGYTISTPVNSFTSFPDNYVNLVVPMCAVGSVTVDGAAVPTSEFQPIGSSGFEGAELETTPGSHVISAGGARFGAYAYGFSYADAYGYAGGYSVVPGVSSGSCREPAFTIQKLQEIRGAGGGFTSASLAGVIGQTADYEIVVENTGNTQLTFGPLTDANCTNLAPSGSITLAPGAKETYTCEHVLTSAGTYQNNATDEGTPPPGEGSPVTHTSNTVEVGVGPAPHWYSDGKLIGLGQPEPVKTKGTLTLYGHGGELQIPCKVKDSEIIENPVGGGAGTDTLVSFVFSGCHALAEAVCPRGEKIEVLTNPPWRTELLAGPPIRDEIFAMELKIVCTRRHVQRLVNRLTGSLTPEVGNSSLEFGTGSGSLAESPGFGTVEVLGTDTLTGPRGDRTITARTP